MSKITSKYQLTIPKAVAQTVGLKPGDEIDCEPAGDIIRVRPKAPARAAARPTTEQLAVFDLASERQRHRKRSVTASSAGERGWTRDQLYET
jgi:AbrB family looped-hinge helix DNA binding protein